MKKFPLHLWLIVIVLVLSPDYVLGFQQRHERDSLKMVRDSLLNVIRVKDSLLMQASLDSLFLNNLIFVLNNENDSLLHELRTKILKEKMDSVRQYSLDSINRDFNRETRWVFRDSLYNIDEDSIRSSLDDLLGAVFHDKARSPEPEILRNNMSRLFYHLSNDSLHFYIINGQNDTIPFVMKKNYADSTALFLVNNKKDSVKVFIYGLGKSSLYMWADDNFKLAQMLKKRATADLIRNEWTSLDKIKIPKRQIPPVPLKLWNTGGDIDIRLEQMTFSHWAKGGSNRVSLLATSRGYANMVKGKLSWNNDYFYRYGILKQEGMDLHKNTEILTLKTAFHHRAFSNYYYSYNAQFDSQIFPGYASPADSIPISKFMGPGRLNMGLGMVYKHKKELELTVDPLSGQFTFVLDTVTINQVKHGLQEDQRVKGELGVRMNLKYKKIIWKDVDLNTTFTVFQSYINSPKPDLDWITDIGFKINKYLSTKFFVYLKYDDDAIIPVYDWIDGKKTKVDEGKFLQVQQTFGVTFTFYL